MQATASVITTVLAALCALGAAPARAENGALVEEIGEPHAGIAPMDHLAAGQMVVLRPGERLVLDYLGPCLRETIVGGVVSVGAEQSVVSGGTVSREKVECDGGRLAVTGARQTASGSGALVIRAAPRRSAAVSVKQN